jgi:hypothetical protein
MLLNGIKPSVIATKFEIGVDEVKAFFPYGKYDAFMLMIKKKFAMGCSTFEISKILDINVKFVRRSLSLSMAKEKRLFALMLMHDHGFSNTRIKEVTGLSIPNVENVLKAVGRDVKSMPYYKSLNAFNVMVDSADWYKEVLEWVVNEEIDDYRNSIRLDVELEFKNRFKEDYKKYVSDELDEAIRIEDDYEYADKVLAVLVKGKKSTKREVIVQALIEYGRKMGLDRESKNRWSRVEKARAIATINQKLTHQAMELEEMKVTTIDQSEENFLANYNSKTREEDAESYCLLPSYLRNDSWK